MSINAVKQWLDEIVIGQNFCPFARFVRDNEQIRFIESSSNVIEDALLTLHKEIHFLENNPHSATTLIVFANGFDDFDDYLDLLDLSNALIEQWGYAGQYQLASFHPDYEFEGEPAHSASHFTNRAPYPILHLLRERDIESVLAHYPHPESIYENNKLRSQELGILWFKQKLASYRK
ncbi:DUF1415 domain-containing protein [Alteromonas sp. ASW11-130]|uniref:DUF1415 domain-containing protein n=1 Tax=Alteromonas sp. ASW11-130 TaxID=3015775 RepID=UPI0022426525|nr:DUF1415 domain-containing protein [Alteromonas sp. ASW11-130]MCW8091538.1 DUF1415 domain-containing protein [Alteromonas sp. ASW11-130]